MGYLFTQFRSVLTKSHTHQIIFRETGAYIKLRGVYKGPHVLATSSSTDKRLHCYVSAPSKESLDMAIGILRSYWNTGQWSSRQATSQLFYSRPSESSSLQVTSQTSLVLPTVSIHAPPLQMQTGPNLSHSISLNKLLLNVQNKLPHFDLKKKISGLENLNFIHIAKKTGARCVIECEENEL